MKRYAAIVCVLACRTPPQSTDHRDAQTVAPVASELPDAAVPIHRTTPREVVNAWNAAHAKHDAKALEALYAPRVEFYGKSLSARACAALKKTAFEKAPDYAQSIRDVQIELADAGAGSIVTFTKTSTVKGKSTDYPAVIVVVGEEITSETDKISEANLEAQRQKDEMWCTESPAYPPNDRVIAPYRISALDAYRRARNSAGFKAEVKASNGDFLDFGQIWCPTGCVHPTSFPWDETHACGYRMKLENHSELQRRINDPNGFSIMVDWVYIDAVDGTMLWASGAKEKLPD